MQVGKNYKVVSDSLNVTLYKRYASRAGDEKWKVAGYYSSIKSALSALVDCEVKETELKDLATVSQKQDELYKLIESLGGNYASVKSSIDKAKKVQSDKKEMGTSKERNRRLKVSSVL